MMIPSIEQFNSLDKNDFLKVVNTLFEIAPPLAEFIWTNKPYKSYSELIDKAENACQTQKFSNEQLIEIINAHPRIGAPKTQLSAMSLKEQGYSSSSTHQQQKPIVTSNGEDEQVMAELKQLNEEYEEKFGFKFVVFVNGRTRKEIVPVMRDRMRRSHAEELTTALNDMMSIARDRLKKSIA